VVLGGQRIVVTKPRARSLAYGELELSATGVIRPLQSRRNQAT
jgi:hypothetical protein